ncbi:MAG: inorganic phosphate transporter [Ignavibacteria bacterium CG_4_9_14_0_2_um_filter_37_13]|nr:MAG: inorganic phosphate transporter [Ignavibacteria bacterium CG_4_9_14_0_2_um_filter_37_13]
MILMLLFLAAIFLAYSNGANDNFKGVATLFGSGTTDYKKAVMWATITTFLGSVTAIFLAGTLVKNFSGKGLIPDELIQTPAFAVSIAFGAASTVFLASKIGMPISTTHGLVGALLGSGLVAVGIAFNFSKLGNTFLMPLIVSPVIALATSAVVYVLFRKIRISLGVTKETCFCVVDECNTASPAFFNSEAVVLDAEVHKKIVVGTNQECITKYNGTIFGIGAQTILDYAHYISSGVVSFARGLNDTPKIVGLLLVINAIDIKYGMITVAIAMAIGGLLNARKVGETVSKKITPMDHGQGFTANLITGLLVTTASLHGLPVSTTHVSVGSIFGIGTVTKKANIKVVSNILMSWLLTLPIAALFSAAIYWLLLKLF